MNKRIQLLDQQCVNQIAAGEVVERPLSVVKELIENALDASARKIEINIEGGGTPLIRVKDDGTGILPDDLHLAILPHATSKISSIEDLNNLQSLGFRGEALPSIASVSRLSILSRPPEEIAGVEIQVEGGELISTAEVGCPSGTVVTVKDLFFNTPARHKFLRSNSTEFGYISDMVSRLALARPDVAFTLKHPNNLILNTPGNGELLEAIAAVFGNNTARRLFPISLKEENFEITGYLSPPDLVRSTNNGITFLINGRVIRSPLLNQALKAGYHTLIPSGTYPIAVIALKIPPSEYDVNVHPAKLEVKFNREAELCEKITKAVRNTLLSARPVRTLSAPTQEKNMRHMLPTNEEQLKIRYHPSISSKQTDGQEDRRERRTIEQLEQMPEQRKAQSGEGKFEKSEKIRTNPITPSDSPEVLTENKVSETIRPDYTQDIPNKNPICFEELRAIGQVFTTYLLCTDETNLYIIDQHAAHERIRYETLLSQLTQTQIASQMLLVPETVDLTVQEEQILLHHLPELQEMGFIVEHFGERTYFLRGIPVLNHLENPGKIFRRFLEEMLNKPFPPSKDKLLEEWVFMLACRSAIKGNDRLTIAELEELIQQLGQTENPLTCPHGRPTIIEITKKELENRFIR